MAALAMASTWPAVFFTEEMLYQKMSMLPSPPSRPRGASSLLTGVQLDLRLESTTNLQLLFQEEILQRLLELFACYLTPQQSLRLGPDLITSLTSCMPRELLFIGMLERAWRKESSLRLVRILLLLRRIMKRWDLTLQKLKMEKVVKNIRNPLFKNLFYCKYL